jgi:hypothetical protein
MMGRFATLALIALMLGAAPAVFAQGSGGSGGSGGGRSDGVGNNPANPGAPPAASGAIEGSPGRLSPGAAPSTPGGTRAARPIDNPAQATTALQAQGYSNVQGLVRSGDVYRGRAIRNGRTVMIEMDARTGTIRETSG